MEFKEGNQVAKGHGRPRGSGSQAKAKYLSKWGEVFDSTNPIKKLTEIANNDYAEFIRLGLAAMPKDTNVDINGQFEITATEFTEKLNRINKMLGEND